MTIENFGRNIRFTPSACCEPANETELLESLNRSRPNAVRVVGSRHSWSPLIETDGTSIQLSGLDRVEVHHGPGGTASAVIGAGAQIKHIVEELNRHGLTLPSLGLITEQTIAGAIATGTHGSGRHSLSHYVEAVRLVHYDRRASQWVVDVIDSGAPLRAARCSLGTLGIVTSVTIPCRPQYYVDETWARYDAIDEVLARVDHFPLQQFYLIPHRWDWIAQHRREAASATSRGRFAWLYRWYFHLTFDIAMPLGILLAARWLRSPFLTRWLLRVLPAFVLRGPVFRDRSDLQLTMKHELFRHLEMELFVPEARVAEAADFLTQVLKVAAGTAETLADDWLARLTPSEQATLSHLRRSFTHHYPICFRRILPDDTLLSMTSGSDACWQSISLITYVEPREPFYAVAEFLACTLQRLCNARLHWGKHVPPGAGAQAPRYPAADRFAAQRQHFDPDGHMQNAFTRRALWEDKLVTSSRLAPTSGD